MKRKLFLLGLVLVITMFLVGCSGGIAPSISLTGNWTMTNSSSSGVTTSKCYINDSSGNLIISNFYIVDQSYINWNTGYGTHSGSSITATVNGSYTNIFSQTVSVVIYFEGVINSSGIYGTGSWLQTNSVGGYIFTYSGDTIFVKG